MPSSDNLRRVAAVYKTEGWPGISHRLRQLWRNLWGYRFYNLYILRIDHAVELWPPRLEQLIGHLRRRYIIEWSDDDFRNHLPEYLQRRKDISQPDLLTWIAAGHRTVIVHDNQKIAGDCWLAMDNFPFPTESKKLTRWMDDCGYTYSYMAFVEPRYRGLGVFPLLLAEQVEYARNNGKSGLMGAVLPRSKGSRQSLESMGFTNRGKLHIIRVLGKNFTKVTFHNQFKEMNSADQI